MLEEAESIHVAAVLEDCVDQLAVLGKIMPSTFEARKDASEIVDDEISQLVEGQKNLEDKYEHAVASKGKDMQSIGKDLKNSTHIFARSLKQSPLTPDNMGKLQDDRAFLETVLFDAMREIIQSGNFESLIQAVKLEKEKKQRLQETILKEEQGRKRVKELQRKLIDVKREKETECQERDEMIAHLKDQLQEMKAKTNMEGKYIKKCAEVGVAQTQKKCFLTENELKTEIDRLRQQVDEETRVNTEIEAYLRTHQTELETKVDYWMGKYDEDVEKKQKELDILKANKAKDLERLQDLTKLYAEYEQIVVEDRVEKEKARRKAELEAEELRAAI
ncbi:unnamed protein product, partial [Owenia fusiformis]